MATPSSTARRALAVLGLAYFIFGTGSLAVVGLVGPMATRWGTSPSAVAQLVTVFSLGFAVLAPAIQVVAAKVPRRSLVVGGLLTVAVGLLGTALAPNLAWAMAFRVLTALGAAAVGPVASSLAASLAAPGQQAQALATVFAGMTLATVVGVPVSAWLGQLLSWQAVFVTLAAAAAACAAAVAALVQDRSASLPVRPADLVATLRRADTGFAFAAALAQLAAQFATYALIAVFLRSRFGASPALVSAALMTFGLGGVAANALVGRIGDRFAADTLIRASLLALAGVFAALCIAPGHAAIALGLLAAWSLVATVFMVPQQKRLIALAPAQRGLLLAMNASSMYLGMSLGTVVGSLAQAVAGVAALPAASLALVGVAWACHQLSLRAPAGFTLAPRALPPSPRS